MIDEEIIIRKKVEAIAIDLNIDVFAVSTEDLLDAISMKLHKDKYGGHTEEVG